MAQSSAYEELIQVQQEVKVPFVESLEQEISVNLHAAQSFLWQQPAHYKNKVSTSLPRRKRM